ncbi:hypothetical protein ACLB1M_30785 [Escherichia coli]
MKTGATDGGRYNVMGGGRPVVALCLPTRYLHANSGMISKADYDALLTLIRGFLTTLTAGESQRVLASSVRWINAKRAPVKDCRSAGATAAHAW